jgi:hypothetical protein
LEDSVNDGDFSGLRQHFVLFLIWLWSLKGYFLAAFLAIWFQWMIKGAVREGVEEALNKTVVPILDDILGEMREEQEE